MYKLFYLTGLWILSFFYFPLFLYQMVFKGKYRKSFKARLGLNQPSLSSNAPLRVWVHAVSLGEAKAIAPLVKALKKERPDSFIIFSTITETGQAEALKSCPEADLHTYLPFDTVVSRFVKEANPHLVILCETDFWFNFLQTAKNLNAKVIVVNGKMSLKSLERHKKLLFLSKPLLNLVDCFIVQSSLYKERFLSLSISPEKILVGGNIKLDSDPAIITPDEKKELMQKLYLSEKDPVLVIGSTHDPEEKIFLKALKPLWEKFPTLKVLLVPRHPERFDHVSSLIEECQIPFNRFSAPITGPKPLTLIDAMGQLKKCYQLSTLSCVAGSWTEKVGGHNILEPSSYGICVLYGPHMDGQPDFLKLMRDYKAGVQISAPDITPILSDLLSNPDKASEMGKRGLTLMHESRGALQKTFAIIKQNI